MNVEKRRPKPGRIWSIAELPTRSPFCWICRLEVQANRHIVYSSPRLAMIRDARLGDRSDIARIYNESIRTRDRPMQLAPIKDNDVMQRLRNLGDREAVLVILEEDEGIGFGELRRYIDRDGYGYAGETSVYLQCGRTGEGYGTMRQKRLLERVRMYDYHHLAGVQQENGYVDKQWNDGAIMQKLL